MSATPFFANTPPLPCLFVVDDDTQESRRWVLTSDASLESMPLLNVPKARVDILLPNGDRLSKSFVGAPDKELLTALINLVAKSGAERAGLSFWGLMQRPSAGGDTRLWIECDPDLPPSDVSFTTASSVYRGASVTATRMTIKEADRTTIRLIADTGDDTFKIRHLLPLYQPDGSMVCDLVPVLATSDRQLPVQVCYPPSIASAFWHFLSNKLHDGAAILGEHALHTVLAHNIDTADLSLLYTAGIYCLRYGTTAQIDELSGFLAKALPKEGRLPQAIARIATLLRAEHGDALSKADQETLAGVLTGDDHRALPLSIQELSHIRDTADDIASAGDASTRLQSAVMRHRSWALRVASATNVPTYDSTDLSGPSRPLSPNPKARRREMMEAKKKSGAALLAVPR